MGTWIQRTPMPTPRHDLQGIAVGGTIYAISGANDLTVDAVEIYDVATDQWTAGPAIPTRRGWLGADRIGNKIYVAGGKTYRPPEERKAHLQITTSPRVPIWRCSTSIPRPGRPEHPCPPDPAPASASQPVKERSGP